jgi:hypothetical protein
MRTGAALHGPPGRHERRRGPRLWRIGEAQDVYRCRPPVSGKSTVFPVSGFGVEFFNADDLAAQLNGGSYRGIPQSIRARVNGLFESFVYDCIARRASFSRSTRPQPQGTGEVTALPKPSRGVSTIPACAILRGRFLRWTLSQSTTTVSPTPCHACCCRLRAVMWFTLPNGAPKWPGTGAGGIVEIAASPLPKYCGPSAIACPCRAARWIPRRRRDLQRLHRRGSGGVGIPTTPIGIR